MRVAILLILLFRCAATFATNQASNKIIYKGKEYTIVEFYVLDAYFEKYPNKRPVPEVVSTALWRGYIATFEIRVNQLYLKDIEVMYEHTTSNEKYDYKWRSVLNAVLPGDSNLKIDWFTGLIIIPTGELLNLISLGYGSHYESCILLEVDKGDIKKEKHFNNKEYEEFKARQFQAFKRTGEYKKIKADLIENGDSEEEAEKYLRIFILEYTSKILLD